MHRCKHTFTDIFTHTTRQTANILDSPDKNEKSYLFGISTAREKTFTQILSEIQSIIVQGNCS